MKIISFKFLLILIYAFSNFNLFAQSSSSYSRFGFGDVDYAYSIRRMGMGQLGTSVADVDFVSIVNPASLYRIGKTRIEFSVNYNGTFLANDIQKNYFGKMEFGGFTVGIPISNTYGVGVAFGIVPFSNVSYNVVETKSSTNSLIGNYDIQYSGSGGLSKAFLSSSYLLPLDFAFGASLDYYFGNTHFNSNIDFANSSAYSGEYERNHQDHGIGGTFGIISPDLANLIELNSISDFRLGLALNLFTDLKGDTLLTSNSLLGLDTLASGESRINLPAKVSVGLSFILNKNYLFSLDFAAQPWTKFEVNGIKSPYLQDAYKYSAGFEYRPPKELGSTFWEQIILRAGLSYEQTQYFVYGKGINQYSVSLGASLPLSGENTIDIALMYARRGTKEMNLFKEDFVKLGIGFSLGELWFIRFEK